MATSFIVKTEDIDQVLVWCSLNFGLPDTNASPFRYDYWTSHSRSNWRFFFAESDDAVMFKLQWHDCIKESIPYD